MEPTYTVVLRAEPEGGYTVLVPALPEIVSYGETIEEAQRMAADAIRCAILGRQDGGEPVPEEGPLVTLPAEERTGDVLICRVTSAPLHEVPVHA
jgi:antitoxin HicB